MGSSESGMGLRQDTLIHTHFIAGVCGPRDSSFPNTDVKYGSELRLLIFRGGIKNCSYCFSIYITVVPSIHNKD